ncbi:MAG: hypothetical protein QM622_09040 [Microbacterium sp.]
MRDGIRSHLMPDAVADDIPADLTGPASIGRVFERPVPVTGSVGILVCDHAKSGGDGRDPRHDARAARRVLAGVTASIAAKLLEPGIILNTVNPWPVSTGSLDPETTDRALNELDEYLATAASGGLGVPSDPAEFIGWLSRPAGSWIAGQVLTGVQAPRALPASHRDVSRRG